MNFKVGDEVVVIAGEDKGKTGKIIRTFKNENKVIVEGVRVQKKHQKGNNNIVIVITHEEHVKARLGGTDILFSESFRLN